ncbi:MAG TPA: hypothetical protein VGM69_09145 [Chloroflexota bacterium]|jgi:hypothetical protein
MKKAISALVLAALVGVTSATAVFAGASEQGTANGLSKACAHGTVVLMNKNCGWRE